MLTIPGFFGLYGDIFHDCGWRVILEFGRAVVRISVTAAAGHSPGNQAHGYHDESRAETNKTKRRRRWVAAQHVNSEGV